MNRKRILITQSQEKFGGKDDSPDDPKVHSYVGT